MKDQCLLLRVGRASLEWFPGCSECKTNRNVFSDLTGVGRERQHGAFTSSESTQNFKIYEPKGTKENNKKSAKNTFIAHPFTHTLIYYCTN